MPILAFFTVILNSDAIAGEVIACIIYPAELAIARQRPVLCE
jgi:hypothetical protein